MTMTTAQLEAAYQRGYEDGRTFEAASAAESHKKAIEDAYERGSEDGYRDGYGEASDDYDC